MGLSGEYERVYREFLDYQRRRTTKAGLATLGKTVRYLLQWMQAEGVSLWGMGFREGLRYRDFVSSRVKANGEVLAVGTLHSRITAGKALFGYLVETEERTQNPFAGVGYPRAPRLVKRNVLTQAEMRTLLDYFARYNEEKTQGEKIKRYRLHVICEFLYATGLRIFEAAALTIEDVHPDEHWVYVAEGKGGRSRIAFMTSFASEVMRLYLEKSRAVIMKRRKTVLTVFGAHEQHLMTKLNLALKASCKKLRIPVITSHGFRHSLGTHLLGNGADIRYIQAVLGHRKLTSTQVYTGVDRDALRDCIDSFHPRSGSPYKGRLQEGVPQEGGHEK
ncbi:MAG: tyrosine-type recombinase/integrase [Spirochaetaceae bacterium]|jgi:site-specific recombinase XerD|nr:tyrosine-type recombinase/integrase [Spirochaetaceae bacterium]